MIFGFLIGRVRCMMGKHHRSRARARFVEGCFRSRCVYCARPMRESWPQGWMLDHGTPSTKNSERQLDLE